MLNTQSRFKTSFGILWPWQSKEQPGEVKPESSGDGIEKAEEKFDSDLIWEEYNNFPVNISIEDETKEMVKKYYQNNTSIFYSDSKSNREVANKLQDIAINLDSNIEKIKSHLGDDADEFIKFLLVYNPANDSTIIPNSRIDKNKVLLTTGSAAVAKFFINKYASENIGSIAVHSTQNQYFVAETNDPEFTDTNINYNKLHTLKTESENYKTKMRQIWTEINEVTNFIKNKSN